MIQALRRSFRGSNHCHCALSQAKTNYTYSKRQILELINRNDLDIYHQFGTQTPVENEFKLDQNPALASQNTENSSQL